MPLDYYTLLAYIVRMNLSSREIEGFTDTITGLLNDEEYAALQEELRASPDNGNLIPGTG